MNTLNEKEVIKLYVEDNLSTYQISQHFNTYPNKIRRILKKHNVELKNKSEAQKAALNSGRSKHPTEGRKRTDDEKLAISKSSVEYWDNLDDETKEERRQTSKKNWESLGASKIKEIRKKATEKIRKAAKEGSKLEKKIQSFLVKMGYKYQSHKTDLIPNKNLEIDLYIPELKTIIEVDGLSHFEPIWGEEQLRKQIKADTEKDGIVLNKGFNVVRIQNKSGSMAIAKLGQLEADLKEILNKIEQGNLGTNLKVIVYE